jgi:hypothetical protein
MLRAHPRPAASSGDVARDCIEACSDCAETCTICADACLHEEMVQQLTHCIRLNLDCADICTTTGRLISRPGHTDAPMLRAQLEACEQACRSCANECEQHARHMNMEHCRVCAEACRQCENACAAMASALVP